MVSEVGTYHLVFRLLSDVFLLLPFLLLCSGCNSERTSKSEVGINSVKLAKEMPEVNYDIPMSSTSDVLHLFRLSAHLNPTSEASHRFRSILLNERVFESYFPHEEFPFSRRGARKKKPSVASFSDRGAESHVGQILATMALVSEPLSSRITMNDGESSLEQALRFAKDECTLDGECDWLLIAFSTYLVGERQWVNRFGDSITIDEVTTSVLDSTLESASCNGTHTLYSLAHTLTIDSKHKLLSPSTRSRVVKRLLRASDKLTETQQSSGCWTYIHEFGGVSGDASLVQSLLLTSHHLEWILAAPDHCRPNGAVIDRGKEFILRSIRGRFPLQTQPGLCAYTHCLGLLMLPHAHSNKVGLP